MHYSDNRKFSARRFIGGLYFTGFGSSFYSFIDRSFLVRKFGNQKVNKVQFSFLGFIILLWIIRFIANL